MLDLWDSMGNLFGARWLKQWGDADGSAFETWLLCMSTLTPKQIKQGFVNFLKDMERTGKRYLPDAMEFKAYCLDLVSFGLPSAKAAYQEACKAPSPKIRFKWSHPAVYQAGVQTGWFELSSMPEKDIFLSFEHIYSQICQKVIAGEDLTVPVPKALPEHIPKRLSQSENIKRLAQLRKEQKI